MDLCAMFMLLVWYRCCHLAHGSVSGACCLTCTNVQACYATLRKLRGASERPVQHTPVVCTRELCMRGLNSKNSMRI